MVNWSWLPPAFAQASERLSDSVGELAGGATVWIAVTGLSRSGKTVFVTSLIHRFASRQSSASLMAFFASCASRNTFQLFVVRLARSPSRVACP